MGCRGRELDEFRKAAAQTTHDKLRIFRDLGAMAYLWDGFAAFELLGPFNRVALAHRVFGPALVQQALEPIMTTLQAWG